MGIFTNWFKKKEPEQETRGLFCDSCESGVGALIQKL